MKRFVAIALALWCLAGPAAAGVIYYDDPAQPAHPPQPSYYILISAVGSKTSIAFDATHYENIWIDVTVETCTICNLTIKVYAEQNIGTGMAAPLIATSTPITAVGDYHVMLTPNAAAGFGSSAAPSGSAPYANSTLLAVSSVNVQKFIVQVVINSGNAVYHATAQGYTNQ